MSLIANRLSNKGFTVTKDTRIQTTAHNSRVRILVNKELGDRYRACVKSSMGGWSEPAELDSIGEFDMWLAQRI